MRTRYLIAASIVLMVTLPGLASCTGGSTTSTPQALLVPTARNSWRLQCVDGTIIDPFFGSYVQALAAPQCAIYGGVHNAYDNGLIPLGGEPPFMVSPDVVAIEPVFRTPLPGDRPVTFATELRERTLALRAGGAGCASAICQDSARNRYDVTYLDGRRRGRGRFNCAAAGLLNDPRGARDVAGSPNRQTAQLCRVGPRLREPAPR